MGLWGSAVLFSTCEFNFAPKKFWKQQNPEFTFIWPAILKRKGMTDGKRKYGAFRDKRFGPWMWNSWYCPGGERATAKCAVYVRVRACACVCALRILTNDMITKWYDFLREPGETNEANSLWPSLSVSSLYRPGCPNQKQRKQQETRCPKKFM